MIRRPITPGRRAGTPFRGHEYLLPSTVQGIVEPFMSEENAPEKDDTMPSAGKQLMVMGIIVVGITVVLGAGVWLSMYLQ